MILEDFYSAAAAFDEEAFLRVVDADVRFSEMPNLINSKGTERDLSIALRAFRRGKELLSAQSFEIHSALEVGDTIAARATWHGTLAATGQELSAHIASFTQVRDGRVYRHATYDCYEPF
jgi:ketosteroid isomerase-like protein